MATILEQILVFKLKTYSGGWVYKADVREILDIDNKYRWNLYVKELNNVSDKSYQEFKKEYEPFKDKQRIPFEIAKMMIQYNFSHCGKRPTVVYASNETVIPDNL